MNIKDKLTSFLNFVGYDGPYFHSWRFVTPRTEIVYE